MKNWLNCVFYFILMLISSSSMADNNSFCVDNLRMGAPSLSNENNILICRQGYALMFNTNTKTPLWVGEHLTKSEIFGEGERAMQFLPDPQISNRFQANSRDYARSGYDQGHMAPAADFSQDQTLMDESFFYSNVVPQNPQHNRQIWASLEKKVRAWAAKRNGLYIVTGPVFSNGRVNQTLGRSQVAIPDAIYKIVYDPNTQNAIAFMIPNQGYPANMLPRFITSVRAVEQATGLNFHSHLPQNIQDTFEVRISGMWTR